MAARHFLTLNDMSTGELEQLLDHASRLRNEWHQGKVRDSLKNRVLAMIFEKSSTRTRVSFEAGMSQLGGSAIFLSPRDTQLGRGEPIDDSARVISSMVDAVMIRTFAHETVERFAAASRVPVINALTDDFHPCQLLADMQTFREHRGSIRGATVAWIGDGNNMAHSIMFGCAKMGLHVAVGHPKGYAPDAEVTRRTREMAAVHGTAVQVTESPIEAVTDADVVYTDVWASMGQEDEAAERLESQDVLAALKKARSFKDGPDRRSTARD